VSHRKQQRESTIHRAIQEVIARGVNDPRVRGLITVTGVRLSDDGRHARVMVSVLPAEKQDLTLHGLRAATSHIRREVMGRIRTREMPAIEFRLDDSVKRQGELLTAINKANEPPGPAPEDEPEDEDAGGRKEDVEA
jgi:ribosome-binding factor A